jgi:chemotaxis-related protein WspB
MLFLVFQLGKDRYAMEARRVIEVLPLVEIRPVPRSPAWLAGLFDCRGAPVPLIDLSELALGHPARRCLSTRIVLAHCPGGDGADRLVGVIVEKATGTLRRDAAQFVDSGVRNDAAPYLGAVASDAEGLLQRIELERLLSPAMQGVLGAPRAAS